MKQEIELKYSCKENWDKMKIACNSRYCESCSKNVVDFTNMNKHDVYNYLKQNKNICGRIQREKIDYYNLDLNTNIYPSKKIKKSYPLLIYSVGTLLVMSCNSEVNNEKNIKNNTEVASILNSDDEMKIDKKDSKEKNTNKQEIEKDEYILMGYICINPETIEEDEPYFYVDQMPEFKGGLDSLKNHIKSNLKYPEWEKKNKIEGTVYVEFIVTKNGNTENIKIVKSVEGSKNFDDEVIKLVSQMYGWKPGRQDDKNVDVLMVIPITFKLN